jgi:hypothetical protein
MSYTSPIFETWSDKILDIDFRSNVPEGMSLGASERNADTFRAPIVFEEKFKLLTDAEIIDFIKEQDARGGNLDRLVVHRYDQNGEGTCTCNAGAAKYNILAARQFGKDRVCPQSPISIYMKIASGPNTGSGVGDCLKQQVNIGSLPIDISESRIIMGKYANDAHFMRAVGYDRRLYKSGWEVTADWFKIHEYYEIDTAQGFKTALANGWPVHYGRSGHSILGVRLAVKSNTIYVIYLNSWGAWGETLNGIKAYGLDSPSAYGTGAQRYGAHCACSVVVPPWEIAA